MSGDYALQFDLDGDVYETIGGWAWTATLQLEGLGEHVKVSSVKPLETEIDAAHALRRASRLMLYQLRNTYLAQGIELRHVSDAGTVKLVEAEGAT